MIVIFVIYFQEINGSNVLLYYLPHNVCAFCEVDVYQNSIICRTTIGIIKCLIDGELEHLQPDMTNLTTPTPADAPGHVRG